MSVRRLAESQIQPAAFSFSPENAEWAKLAVDKYPEGRQQSAVIPLLMRAQEQDGWVTKAAIETVADMLAMPYIRALEVATFYTQFQLKPVGTRAHIQVCGTTPCMLRGSEALMELCRSRIHHDQFAPNAAGTLSWEEVECLGACVNAPMVMIFKDTYEDLTPERLGEIIDAFEAGASVPPGPQNGRMVSAPASGLTTLLDEKVLIEAADRHGGPAPSAGTAQSAEPATPPSKAARPATDAIETNSAVKTPSPVKVDRAEEGAAESEAPTFDKEAANRAEPAVEGSGRQRQGKSLETDVPEQKAPEMLQGRPIGPTGERAAPNDKGAPDGLPSPEGGNMTREGTPVAYGVDDPGGSKSRKGDK